MPWLACPYGGGGTQCKGLLSQQMASQVGQNHPKFEGGKVVSAVVMPPQAHRELQGKQNKTKQNSHPIPRQKRNERTKFSSTFAKDSEPHNSTRRGWLGLENAEAKKNRHEIK